VVRNVLQNKTFEGSLYRSLERNSHVGIYIMQDGAIQLVNNYTLRCLGRKREELLGKNFMAYVHPEDRQAVRESTIRMLKDEIDTSHKFRIIRSSGEFRWIDGAVTSLRYRGRRAILGSSIDITEQMRSWHKVLELETLESSILKAIPHAVIGIRDRHVFFANSGVRSVFGWDAEEMIGKNTRILYRSDEEYEEIGGMAYPAIQREGIFTIEYPCLKKDGTEIECRVSASGIGETQEERNIVAIYEDITQRKRAERKLEESRVQLRKLFAHLQSVREKERTRIARELHDELGQLLMALNTDIILLKKHLSPEERHLDEKIASMSSLITITMDTLHRIYKDLRPAMLDHLGLVAAIDWQAKDFQKRTGIECTVRVEPEEFDIAPELATTIFRIFQETLTNVSRHSAATKISVSLNRTDREIYLRVQDNGKGIRDEDMVKLDSFGLMGIKERVYHCGGTVSIEGTRGRGTRIAVTIPCAPPGEAE